MSSAAELPLSQLSNAETSQNRSPTPQNKQGSPSAPQPSAQGDTVKVPRGRPRGRPRGSKNKPKPSTIIIREPSDPPPSNYFLEIPPGQNIIRYTILFSRELNTGLGIITGRGTVINANLRAPSGIHGRVITAEGRYQVLSITGTISAAGDILDGSFAITLGGERGQVIGGLVVGPLVAASTVVLAAVKFNSPSYQRLRFHGQDAFMGGGGKFAGDGAGDRIPGVPSYGYMSNMNMMWASDTVRQPEPEPELPPY